MKLLVINPNTTASMTQAIDDVAQRISRPETRVVTVQPDSGPASIQGFLDIARSLDGILTIADQHKDADATVVACFDDTGLDALRCIMDGPVIGIGESSFHAASMIACRFSVVTTLSRSIVGITDNLAKYGLVTRCSSIRASEVPVLALESDPDAARARIEAEISGALKNDGAEAIVLGCSGMASFTDSLTAKFGVPVIDGISSAVAMAEALVSVGLKTSKIGAYASENTGISLVERAIVDA
ncbi:aspartate/glutamate racemase family protein [Sulfitobacter sp. SK011]|uniref:aspartate/glutamate racemase family protein n=1 Tax=Sulfitobacter sp. SK011 TaxID=1389004 RepID=UPI000E0B15C2|nr:aspartate/glutamate racemase family protein [Sulfitobacter sp. SK011]AXI43977.1 Asp/Glu/hydantoin racemase [Sulfitobacter sp. SK011]